MATPIKTCEHLFDKDGNEYVLYPVTKTENIIGLPEALETTKDDAVGDAKEYTDQTAEGLAPATHSHPTDTSRAPTNHASSATTYGPATINNYGHVRLAGNALNDYAIGGRYMGAISNFNIQDFCYEGTYYIQFQGNTNGVPGGLTATNTYYGVLTTKGNHPTQFSDFGGVQQTLYIASENREWTRRVLPGPDYKAWSEKSAAFFGTNGILTADHGGTGYNSLDVMLDNLGISPITAHGAGSYNQYFTFGMGVSSNIRGVIIQPKTTCYWRACGIGDDLDWRDWTSGSSGSAWLIGYTDQVGKVRVTPFAVFVPSANRIYNGLCSQFYTATGTMKANVSIMGGACL